MTTAPFRTALAGLLLATVCASKVMAADGFMREITVQIVASPGIDAGTLAAATAIVGRIYQNFDVRLQVTDSAGPSTDGRTPWRRLMVKTSATKEFPLAFGTFRVMGVSPRNGEAPGRIGYVFYDAVSHTAKQNDLPAFVLLGYAMAHELGHLLLAVDAHGQTGVMRGNWDANDMKRMRAGTLAMADREITLMYGYLDSLQHSR
jgi:hypothetical protein